MKQFINKLIERLEEKALELFDDNLGEIIRKDEAIDIVNQLAEETEKDPNWQTTRNYLDVKYFSKIRELSAKYNYPCENVPINFDWVFGLIDKIETQLAEEYNNDFCEWKSEKDMFIQNPHTGRKFSNEPSMRNVYCNTCGKKIKVVPYQPKGE